MLLKEGLLLTPRAELQATKAALLLYSAYASSSVLYLCF